MASHEDITPRLVVDSISRNFGSDVAVEGVSLTLLPGQVTCLLGPSGCGKSTTLRIIAGVENLDSGRLYVDGDLICGGGVCVPPEKREIGLMFQDFALFPHLSVWENVAFGLKGAKSDRRMRAEALLQRIDLEGYADKMPDELSGGEQQRVALARAVAPRPKIMLMDEPFSGLDDRLRDDVRDETLRVLKEDNTAVVMVTHDPVEAMKMSDQIALMRDGKIVQLGAPYAIYNQPVDKEAAGFFSDINVFKAIVDKESVQTPFGSIVAYGYDDGAEIDVVIRPQHIRIDFDRGGDGPHPTKSMGQPARAIVKRARFLGTNTVVDFELDTGETVIASVASVFLPKIGTPFWLMAPRNRCYVFPVDANDA